MVRQTCLMKSFLRTRNFDNSDISVLAFLYGTNVKLYNVPVTAKIVKKVIAGPDSSDSNCIVVVVFKKLTRIFLYVELLFGCCFPDYSHQWPQRLRMLKGGRSMA